MRLFASILRRDPEGYVLVTPVEKVASPSRTRPSSPWTWTPAPEGLRFRTNLDEEVAGRPRPPHPRGARPGDGRAPRPTSTSAAASRRWIDRKTFYRLVELGEVRAHEGADWFGVESGGAFFPIAPADDLPG